MESLLSKLIHLHLNISPFSFVIFTTNTPFSKKGESGEDFSWQKRMLSYWNEQCEKAQHEKKSEDKCVANLLPSIEDKCVASILPSIEDSLLFLEKNIPESTKANVLVTGSLYLVGSLFDFIDYDVNKI